MYCILRRSFQQKENLIYQINFDRQLLDAKSAIFHHCWVNISAIQSDIELKILS